MKKKYASVCGRGLVFAGFFLFFSYALRAQQTIDLFGGVEETYGEMNMWDPHYKADGTIDYWGIGHFVRLTRTNRPDGKPEKATLTLWDKNDWEKFQEKKYIYADGRLKEEQVWQYKRVTLDDDYPKLVLRSRHYVDEATRTDSIVTSVCLNLEPLSFDTLVVVNCKNRQERLDSTRTYRVNNGKCQLIGKNHISYKKKKPVEILTESYWRAGERIMLPDGTFRVYPFDEEDKGGLHIIRQYVCFNYEPHGYTCFYIRDDKKNRPYMQQSVKLDAKKRLCAVELSGVDRVQGNPVSILHAEYQYDDRQHTTVHKVINPAGLAIVEEEVGMLGKLATLVGVENLKYDLTYTDDGTEKIEYHLIYDKQEGKYLSQRTTWLTYTPTGRVATVQTDSYMGGELYNKEREMRTYNEKDEVVERLCYHWNEEDGWWLLSKYVYDYDDRGNRTLEQRYRTYDEGETWRGQEHTRRTFDAAGRVLSEYNYAWEDNHWVDERRTLWTYTANGKVASRQESYYDSFDQVWRGSEYYTIAYNENDSIKERVDYEFRATDESTPGYLQWAEWVPKYKWYPETICEYVYLPHGKQETVFKWREKVKTPWSRECTFAVSDSTSHSSFSWDREKGEWEEYKRKVEYSKGDSLHVKESYDIYNEAAIFAGNWKEVEETNREEGIFRKTKYAWNFDKNGWEPQRRYTDRDKEDRSEHTVEVYDATTGGWIEEGKGW